MNIQTLINNLKSNIRKILSTEELLSMMEINDERVTTLIDFKRLNKEYNKKIYIIMNKKNKNIKLIIQILYKSFAIFHIILCHANQYILNYGFYLVSIKVYIKQFYYIFL